MFLPEHLHRNDSFVGALFKTKREVFLQEHCGFASDARKTSLASVLPCRHQLGSETFLQEHPGLATSSLAGGRAEG